MLKGVTRGRPTRHQTLRQAVAWSYELLDPRSQRFFRRLGAFPGGWTIDAADALCAGDSELEGNAFGQLTELADHSLVRQADGSDGEPRFTLLETIRAYALDQLTEAGEEQQARELHALCYLDLAEEAEPKLTGAEQAHWLDRLETENNNIRGAMQWAKESGDAGLGLRFGSALWRFWIARGARVRRPSEVGADVGSSHAGAGPCPAHSSVERAWNALSLRQRVFESPPELSRSVSS